MDAILQMIYSNAFSWMKMIKISLKLVLIGPINNIPALVQKINWRWSIDKPLSEPIKVNLLMHIYVTRSQWVNSSPLDKMAATSADDNFKCIFLNENDRIPIRFSLKFVLRSPVDNTPALVQVMACRLFGAKPLPERMLTQFTDAYIRHSASMS